MKIEIFIENKPRNRFIAKNFFDFCYCLDIKALLNVPNFEEIFGVEFYGL